MPTIGDMNCRACLRLGARFFVFSGLDLARAAALRKNKREEKGMKRKLAAVLPALVMALLLGLSVFFVACDSSSESGGQNTEQSGEEQEGTEQGGGNEGETGGESGEEDETGGETGEEGDGEGETGEEGGGEGETGGEDPAPVPDVSDKLVFTLNDEGTAYSVTDMDNSAAGSVTIPSTYNGLPVTSIGNSAFLGCRNLTRVTILEGVTSIGDTVFWNCSSLASVMIGKNVTSISMFAFSYCSGLTEIIVAEGNSVYHSEGNCLIETESKTLISGCQNSVIPTDGSVTSIGSYAFYGCESLMEITIPTSMKSIGQAAFRGCKSLTEITIPAGVTSIGDRAFSGCSSLTEITIPASVTGIGWAAFSRCSDLTSVTFENTEGWRYAMYSTALNQTKIASSDLVNPATAATYLTSTYCDYGWYRS